MIESKNNINPGPFVLASILTSYPDSDFQTSIKDLLEDENIVLPMDLNKSLVQLALNSEMIDNLRSDYISIFDHAKSLNPLYETEYGRARAMFKTNELSDIAGFYRAFGFEINLDAGKDMMDHISVELEFYSLLLMKHLYLQECQDINGCAIVFDGMKKFMESHLGRFVPAILEREGVKSSDFYFQVFTWIEKIVNEECMRIGITPDVAKWFSSETEGESITCGGTVSIKPV